VTKLSEALGSQSCPGRVLQILTASRRKGRKLAAYYEAQNDQIASLLKPLSAHTADGEQDVKNMALKVKLAVNISFFANCCLAVLQLYAAISSGSLSLFATCADSGKLL
jgi:hypothetical protein